MNEFIKRTEGNVTYVDFHLHRATVAMQDNKPPRTPRHEVAILEIPEEEEPLPEELITITNYLRDHYPRDYGEIGAQISVSCSDDTPGRIILQEVLSTLENERPIIFRQVSRLLAGAH